ncbi:hypothetical protein E1B28_002928 [Marasmius oreades]|uniref:Uncharacterized protein n=1 Tax=Marasmius oreades TaxID=181124 RepID=A0A9P7RKG2_9AGAR|nr:uncharacterized protein E1B28_002928 [Marasmius oreades]KAG7085365.1 hypothetical protein E1B28_002928 [Marasmius oreades]
MVAQYRASQDQSLVLSRTFTCPWKWWNVLVWRGRFKGQHTLVDVTFSTKTASRLRVHVRSNVANTSSALFVVDYDDVIDPKLFLPLHLVAQPPKAFLPPHGYLHPAIPLLEQFRAKVVVSNEPEAVQKKTTPPPDPAASSSTDMDVWNPNWNPKAVPEANPEAEEQPPLLRTGPGFEWWRRHHSSQHDFYNLLPNVAECLSFQVILTGSIPDLNGRQYAGPKSFEIFLWRHGNSEHQVLTVKWQQLKGRIPPQMIVQPVCPTKKTKLPMVVLRGEHEVLVVTKITAIGEEIWVKPMDPVVGKVHDNWHTMKVSPGDCCMVCLLNKATHEKWSKYNAKPVRDGH